MLPCILYISTDGTDKCSIVHSATGPVGNKAAHNNLLGFVTIHSVTIIIKISTLSKLFKNSTNQKSSEFYRYRKAGHRHAGFSMHFLSLSISVQYAGLVDTYSACCSCL
jgi:hypothetical protein